MSGAEIHAAATLILVRDRAAGTPELLMIQRSAAMAFGAGAWVFPGGRVDPGDIALAAACLPTGATLDDHAARVAAIRETIEEAGVAVGLDPLPDPPALLALRAALHAGEPFAALLDRFRLRLKPEALLPFSRWLPPEGVPRRFDTRFYLASAPEEAAIAADGGETIQARWITARDMIDREDHRLMFPTLCNLERVAACPSFAALAAHAAAFPDSLIVPDIREIEGGRFLCVPDGQGYPDIRVPITKAVRA